MNSRAGVEMSLKLENHRLKRVTEVKFLGVKMKIFLGNREPQIYHLKKKLISSIIVIKPLSE